MLGVVLLASSLGSTIGRSVRRGLGQGVLSGLDRGAGGAFGLARGVFVVWLLGGLLAIVPVTGLAVEARGSLILRALETRLPSPVALASELSRALAEAGLPDVFLGPAPPAEPVDTPEQQEANLIAEPARASTYRVEAVGCARLMSGSGWVVEPGYVVTNAHVIAGASQIWLSFDGMLERYDALPVSFDPDLDAALLYVAGLDGPTLELAGSTPERGTTAAALGYTGGGRLRVIPTAINRTIEAVGRDIYGRQTVRRTVIEMNAEVAPGDSGGPVVLADGTVGGVTFSESRTERTTGYALTPEAVAASIEDGRGSTTAVSPGACLP